MAASEINNFSIRLDTGYKYHVGSSSLKKSHSGVSCLQKKCIIGVILACFPIFGQILGFIALMAVVDAFKSSKYPSYLEKIELTKLLLRSILMILGLGIICLFIDIIITIFSYSKMIGL